MAQNWRFVACWANLFAKTPLEGLRWAKFFAVEPMKAPRRANFVAVEHEGARCWANFFAEMSLEGPCWASFFANRQSWDSAGRVVLRRGPGSLPRQLPVGLTCA